LKSCAFANLADPHIRGNLHDGLSIGGSRGLDAAANFQLVMRPGGGATNPLGSNPGRKLRNAEVVMKF
jgi:hypothetical protein